MSCDDDSRRILSLIQAARYQQAYAWFVFASALDLMMTWIVLSFGGREVNIIADHVLQRWQLPGMVLYKFLLVVLIIFICEVVGHFRPALARALAWFSVVVTLVPVIIAFSHLLDAVHGEPASA